MPCAVIVVILFKRLYNYWANVTGQWSKLRILRINDTDTCIEVLCSLCRSSRLNNIKRPWLLLNIYLYFQLTFSKNFSKRATLNEEMRRGKFVEEDSPRLIACQNGYNCNSADSNPLTNEWCSRKFVYKDRSRHGIKLENYLNWAWKYCAGLTTIHSCAALNGILIVWRWCK